MKTIALYQAFRHNGLEYPQNVEHGIIEAQSREGRGIGFGQSGLERRKLVGHLECLYPRAEEDRLDSIGYGSNLSPTDTAGPSLRIDVLDDRRLFSPFLDAQEIVASFVTLQASMVFTSSMVFVRSEQPKLSDR